MPKSVGDPKVFHRGLLFRLDYIDISHFVLQTCQTTIKIIINVSVEILVFRIGNSKSRTDIVRVYKEIIIRIIVGLELYINHKIFYDG